jgi:hypothetical protein
MPWDMSYLEKDHKTNSYKPETLVGTKEELPSHYCLVAKVRGSLFFPPHLLAKHHLLERIS